MTVYALNGLGRIGKLALKPLLARGAKIAWINDTVGDPEMHAHLLEFDTVHGRWRADFTYDTRSVSIDGNRIPFIGTRDIADLPLEGVDVVIEPCLIPKFSWMTFTTGARQFVVQLAAVTILCRNGS